MYLESGPVGVPHIVELGSDCESEQGRAVGEYGVARGFVGWRRGYSEPRPVKPDLRCPEKTNRNIGTGQMTRREINLGMILQRQTS